MTPDVAAVCLRADHAIELGELLEFLGCLIVDAPDVFADALGELDGGAYPLEELAADLARFAFLLGGDGEHFVFEHAP